MNRQQIVAEIKRVALDNGGRAPGRQSFERATGIKMAEWYPHIWLRWGEALAEAGHTPNQLQTKASDDLLIEKYIGLVRELGRLPVEGEIKRKAKGDASFPNHGAFHLRFGGKQKQQAAVAEYCRKTSGFDDILALVEQKASVPTPVEARREATVATGYVYLMKSGPHYKIGRTNSVGRRGSELAIKIPVPPTTIHSIETDDPVGVEVYWHRRFDDKRGEGEWFALSQEDVKAFKRWKRIV